MLLLAACSSGLEELPELEASASTKTAESRVSSYGDNAEERTSGLVINSSTDLELTHDTLRGQQLIGLRFDNVKVPRGADIKDAYIQFKADEADSGSIKVRIHAHDTDDASGFSQGKNRDISKRSKTSKSVSWDIDAWKKRGERGSKQRTPDLDDVVEEVTDRKGWDAGNAVVFIISSDDKNDRRVAESYRGDKGGAPQLVIKYSGGDKSSGSRSAPVSSGPKVSSGDADYYVSPNGSDSNSGSKSSPFKTLYKVSQVVKPGDTVFLRGGEYKGKYQSYFGYDRSPFKTDGKKGSPITIMSYPGERAIVNGRDRRYSSYKSVCSPTLFKVTADYYVIKNITFKDSAGRGLFLRGKGNVVEGVKSHDNHCDGIYISGSDNRVENFESYNNNSRQNSGESADGIKVLNGSNNVVRECLVYGNSDDGVDIWDTKNTLVENCTSRDNGRGSAGDANGFKVGSRGSKNTGNTVRNNKAEDNNINFTTNNSTGVTLTGNVSRGADSVGFSIGKGNKACDNKSSGERNSVRYNQGCGNSW